MQLLKSIRVFYKDRLNFWLVSVAGFSILATWFLFLFKNFVRSDLTVLHYNIYFGVDWYGAWWNIFFMPIIGAVILLVNTVITMIYGVKDAVLIHMLWVNTLLCEFILLIAIIFTTLLNLTYI